MTIRIAFFEPHYSLHNINDWEIRGSYKYPSLLGDLHERAAITILMSALPPEEDRHRQTLERDFGASFCQIATRDDAGEFAGETLFADYAATIADHTPDIVSTLNGRMIDHNFALARAANDAAVEFVYRMAGNDILTRTSVYEAQGRPVSGTGFWANLLAQERYIAEIARTIIVMGGTERVRAESLTSNPGKIRICQRGVDRDLFTPNARVAERCDRILYLGRNSKEKGIDLIEAAAALLVESRPDLRFTIAGDFEPHEESNRRYLGFHEYRALPGLYKNHHALLLPARSEGFPQVVMEAMSCGLPAILSRHLFQHDFEPGQGAALVSLDGAAIAEQVTALHDDPAGFRAMREAALETANARFDAGRNSSLYHDALLGVSA